MIVTELFRENLCNVIAALSGCNKFSKDIPATYKSFGQWKSLSQLEQRICILLILNIPEKNISLMTDSYASTVSNAKARANEKLYGKKDAHSLKNNLINGLKRS